MARITADAMKAGALGFSTPARAFRAMLGEHAAALLDAYGGQTVDHTALLTESVLARLHMVVHMPPGVPIPQAVYGFQLEKVTAKEKELIAAANQAITEAKDAAAAAKEAAEKAAAEAAAAEAAAKALADERAAFEAEKAAKAAADQKAIDDAALAAA